MYFFSETTMNLVNTRRIIRKLFDGGIEVFDDEITNEGIERMAYLAWVAEGNTATEWSPEA
jgi:hypothetical protein